MTIYFVTLKQQQQQPPPPKKKKKKKKKNVMKKFINTWMLFPATDDFSGEDRASLIFIYSLLVAVLQGEQHVLQHVLS